MENEKKGFNQESQELLERYVYAVSKRLPKAMRQDVELELKSQILDMMQENTSQEELKRVIKGLGSPSKLALAYRYQDQVLISSRSFHVYVDVLKIALWIFLGLTTVGAIIDRGLPLLLNPTTPLSVLLGLSTLVGEIFFRGLSTGVMTFGWVTLIWVLIDRNISDDDLNSAFDFSDLPDLPEYRKQRYQRKNELLKSVLIASLFALLLSILRFTDFAAIALGSNIDVHLYLPEHFAIYYPGFMALIAFYLIARFRVIQKGRLDNLGFILQVAYNVGVAVVAILFIRDPRMFSENWFTIFGSNTAFLSLIRNLINILSAVVILGTNIDLYKLWRTYHYEKSNKNPS